MDPAVTAQAPCKRGERGLEATAAAVCHPGHKAYCHRGIKLSFHLRHSMCRLWRRFPQQLGTTQRRIVRKSLAESPFIAFAPLSTCGCCRLSSLSATRRASFSGSQSSAFLVFPSSWQPRRPCRLPPRRARHTEGAYRAPDSLPPRDRKSSPMPTSNGSKKTSSPRMSSSPGPPETRPLQISSPTARSPSPIRDGPAGECVS